MPFDKNTIITRLEDRLAPFPVRFAVRIRRMRNILIHEYLDVDDAILFVALNCLAHLSDFAASIASTGLANS